MQGDVDVDRSGGKRLTNMPSKSCGWVGCALCSRSIRARRAAEIAGLIHEWETGHAGQTIMVTIAPPHSAETELEDLIGRLARILSEIGKGGIGRELRERFGLRFRWTAWEAQVGGVRGDHPHLHMLFLIDPSETEDGKRVQPHMLADWLLAHDHRPGRSEPRTGRNP